jgi:hypothetical protein
MLLAQAVPPRVVMEILGHSSLDVTMNIYGHVMLDAQPDALRAMDCLSDKSLPSTVPSNGHLGRSKRRRTDGVDRYMRKSQRRRARDSNP